MVSADEIHALTYRLNLEFFAFLSGLLPSLSFESHLGKLLTNSFLFAFEVGPHFELPLLECLLGLLTSHIFKMICFLYPFNNLLNAVSIEFLEFFL